MLNLEELSSHRVSFEWTTPTRLNIDVQKNRLKCKKIVNTMTFRDTELYIVVCSASVTDHNICDSLLLIRVNKTLVEGFKKTSLTS